MKKLFVSTAIFVAIASTAAASGHLGNNGQNQGNKNGWNGGILGGAPKGLIVSGDNGRVDNGGGNGGEGLILTPNPGGEDGIFDQDPN